MPMGEYPVSHACECGAAIKMTPGVTTNGDTLEHLDGIVERLWLRHHSGVKGHGPCTPYEANRVRNNWLNRKNRKARRDAARVTAQ